MADAGTPGRIAFDGVWKKFRRGQLHDSLRDLVPAMARRLVRGAPRSTLGRNEFWAVRDVSFTVTPGEALGIIGPNGAGKSTILKLLTRILRPTAGYRHVEGRIGSLIEIAAGFHPDLTGRENVYLQGAIMGMSRARIREQFDAIVAFAEVEDFVETPVKRYSSGMNARLGFAIAVHLKPDVLIVDEVLAVGDYAFQQKAFDRMRELARRSIPVVIVSHQLERIAELCTDCILLDHGRVLVRGSPQACISRYVMGGLDAVADAAESPIRIESMSLQTPVVVHSGEFVRFALQGRVQEPAVQHATIAVAVRALRDSRVVFSTTVDGRGFELPARGSFHLDVELQANVGSGLYAIEATVWHSRERRDLSRRRQVLFQVAEDTGFSGWVNMHAKLMLADTAISGGDS